jgi:uncharacterized protein (DUF58 family)
MIKNWSRTILALIVLPIVVAPAAVLSTTPYLVVAVLFPLIFLAMLLNYNVKPRIRFLLFREEEEEESNAVYVNDTISIRARVIIEGGLGLYFVRLPSMNSFELVDEDTNVHIIFKGLRKVEQREYVYRMKALRRGIFRLPDITYTFYPPLGFSRGEQETFQSDMEIKVLPKISLLKRSQVSLRSLHEIPRSSRARLGPHSTEFLSIREYTTGDPYKFINWKASSRNPSQDKLFVNEYEREGLRTILFILDRSEVMRLGTAEENPLEYGIAFILSYSRILLNHGLNVGLWLEPSGETAVSPSQRYGSYVVPSSGTDHYERIKEILIATEPRPANIQSQLVRDKNFGLGHSLLLRIVQETVPMIVVVTNLEKSNRVSIARFSRELFRAGASSITVLDVMPYNIISKYTSAFPERGENLSVNVGLFMKSMIVKTKKKDHYSILPKSVKIVDWDPASEPVGRAIKLSMKITKRSSNYRR